MISDSITGLTLNHLRCLTNLYALCKASAILLYVITNIISFTIYLANTHFVNFSAGGILTLLLYMYFADHIFHLHTVILIYFSCTCFCLATI